MVSLDIRDNPRTAEKYQKRQNITKSDLIQTGTERKMELNSDREKYLQLANDLAREFGEGIMDAKNNDSSFNQYSGRGSLQ